MYPERRLLEELYRAFNARDIDAALAAMHPDVDWPNGMDGGRVHGRSAVRDYWTRQWTVIDPHVEPLGFEIDEAGRTVVRVQQTIRNPAGRVLKDEVVEHAYELEDDLIRRMDSRKRR
ncbi:MAG: nuclear transport factor 2 family protein [Candidatus Binatia bacterium]